MNFYGKNKQKKKKAVVLLAALAVMAMIASTFAWTSYVDWKKNHMQSRGFETGEVSIVEQFPKPEITPDATVKKEVGVVNASDSNVFVRISFEEMLHKLEVGAESKGYDTLVASAFPIIIDSSEYTKKGTLWVDQTSELRIDGVAPKAPTNGDIGYKFYTNDKQRALIYVKKTKRAYYPTNFEFDLTGSVLPIFSGDFTNDDVQVAQKITGVPVKQADNTYNYKTVASGETVENGALQYFGYGKEITAKKLENNWAGSSINLSAGLAASKPVDPTKAATDNSIIYNMTTVGTDAKNIGSKDWFYNKEDGYFYYTKKLLPSTSTSSTVIQSIKYPKDQTFSISSFDLWVGMEAIPSYLAAMEATVDDAQIGKGAGGWGLTNKSSDLYKYFEAIADAE